MTWRTAHICKDMYKNANASNHTTLFLAFESRNDVCYLKFEIDDTRTVCIVPVLYHIAMIARHVRSTRTRYYTVNVERTRHNDRKCNLLYRVRTTTVRVQ
jgi:hypothetical protein